MYVAVWKFIVFPEHADDFEHHYGPNGTWVQLFRKAPGYVRTELFRGDAGEYLTLDYWENADAFRAFRETHAEEYARLDEELAKLTEREEAIVSATHIQCAR